ncbi:MAG: hypothetical protein LBQ88_12900 [Treponema sp.]|jgi:hypothetical protein|nr:hypothetical protein [Treponema sp.]
MNNSSLSLRQRIVRYLCAKDQNTNLADESLAAYFHAFESSFDSGAPFTLYAPAANKLVLYVYEENCDYLGSPRHVFSGKCRKIVEGLTEIAGILIDLAEDGYITLEYSEKARGGLPADCAKNWRLYENIYTSESDALLYIMSVKITPTGELYRLNQRRRLAIRGNRDTAKNTL